MKNKLSFILFFLLSSSAFSLEPPEELEQKVKAKKLIEDNCSNCHSNESLGIPSYKDLSLWSQEALFFSMESGKMKPMSSNLSKTEKKLIAITDHK